MKHLLLVALAAGAFLAADASGTWTGTLTPTNDGQSHPAQLVLKQTGETLSGTAGPGDAEQQPIRNGKVDGANLTFEVASDGGVMKFVLKQDGDNITGDVTREREGETQTAKLAVKRAALTKP